MNQQQRIRSQRLKQAYRSQTGLISLDDDDINILVQDDMIMQQRPSDRRSIQIDSDDDEPVKPCLPPAKIEPPKQRDIQPKLDIEPDEEPKKKNNPVPNKRVRFDDEDPNPMLKFPQTKEIFKNLQQKIGIHMVDQQKNHIERVTIVKPREHTDNPQSAGSEISYTQFQYLKMKELNEAKLRKQVEEQKKIFMKEKQLEKVAPNKRRENESIQQYMERMILQMNRDNKSTKKKFKKGVDGNAEQQQPNNKRKKKDCKEEQMLSDLMKMYNGEPIDIMEPQIRPQPQILNYDVIFKTGKIVKQAMMKPPESDQNPMLNVYKGRYAADFIFSGGIDFEDGPYGSKLRKKPKLPFPKHRLTLQPWEYYGVAPDEYFATKDPHFTFKAKYVPVTEYYNELPRPKPDPKYYIYDVEQLLGKRYSEKHQEIQFQATYVGYQKKHWTPLHHLKGKCPHAVLQYEIYERNRLYCEVLNVKVKKVKYAFSICMLSHRISAGKREAPQVIYLKGGENNGQPNGQIKKITVSNLEKQVEEREEEVEPGVVQDEESSDNGKEKRTSKFTRQQEDEWDPSKDDTVRALRNTKRKEKIEKCLQEAQQKLENKKKQQKEPKEGGESKNTNKKKKGRKPKGNTDVNVNEINQFEMQQEQMQEESIFESQQHMGVTQEDIAYSTKLKQINDKKQHLTDTQVDIQESLIQFQQTQGYNQSMLQEQKIYQQLDQERYKKFMKPQQSE